MTRLPTQRLAYTTWKIERPVIQTELVGLIEVLSFDLVCAAVDDAEKCLKYRKKFYRPRNCCEPLRNLSVYVRI